jgi:superfamily I DNA/RNA helicase
VAVVVHSERHWDATARAFKDGFSDPFRVLERRGERIDPNRPIVILARPSVIGGQEFDAVISVGLEQGTVPPVVHGHDGLKAALEQQALREMYLVFTRARFRLLVVNGVMSTPSPLLNSAIGSGLLAVPGG